MEKTSEPAGRYAAAFGEEKAGDLLGWFHDAGKASELFQGVLCKRERNVNHAAAGAAETVMRIACAHCIKSDCGEVLNSDERPAQGTLRKVKQICVFLGLDKYSFVCYNVLSRKMID